MREPLKEFKEQVELYSQNRYNAASLRSTFLKKHQPKDTFILSLAQKNETQKRSFISKFKNSFKGNASGIEFVDPYPKRIEALTYELDALLEKEVINIEEFRVLKAFLTKGRLDTKADLKIFAEARRSILKDKKRSPLAFSYLLVQPRSFLKLRLPIKISSFVYFILILVSLIFANMGW